MEWQNIQTFHSRKYVCGYCGNPLASNKGFVRITDGHYSGYIYICHHCDKPTFFDSNGAQTPGFAFGEAVSGIPSKEVDLLYNEARNSFKCNAYTASVLCCRKLLMNIAVSKGAKQNLSFADYVEFLSERGFIPPDGKEWVDHIRRKGNEATHEITIMGEEDAKELLSFLEMLLKFIYEFPSKIRLKKEK